MTTLKGITWDHPRGIDALRAAGDLFTERTSIRIDWSIRPLSEFEDTPVSELARTYDLIAMDHPFIGDAVADGALHALDLSLSSAELDELTGDAAGLSQKSYAWSGSTYAGAVDAACMVSASRASALDPDAMPRTWSDVKSLSDRIGREKILLAANPTHAWASFLSLCENVAPSRERHTDGRPHWWTAEGIDPLVAAQALRLLRDLLEVCSPLSAQLDPIAVLERLAGSGDEVYAPLIFGYVTYARPRSGRELLNFANAPSLNGDPIGTLTGGVGLAVSALSSNPDAAAHFVRFATSRDVQGGAYVDAGGQAGRWSVWSDERVNAVNNQFYVATLDTMNRAFLRPRAKGYPNFQRSASDLLHALLFSDGNDQSIVEGLGQLWRAHVDW